MMRLWIAAPLSWLLSPLSGVSLSAAQPQYCESTSNADAAACFASRPSYCDSTSYANSKACSGPGKPTPGQVMDVARRIGAPVNVSRLMQELMK